MSRTFADWSEDTLARVADLVTGELTLEQELELRREVDAEALAEFEAVVGELSLLTPQASIPEPSLGRITAGVLLEVERAAPAPAPQNALRPSSGGARAATHETLDRSGPGPRAPQSSPWTWAGWLAAAALLLQALGVFQPTDSDPEADLIASLAGAPEWAWQRQEDPLAGSVEGSVVWDEETDRGYMSFRGLPVNDPSAAQYQLWILDRSRPTGQEQPIDGGVFDITGDEVRIPIEAKLPVGDALLFAVTLEAPGGVVVSEREHLLVIAGPG